MPTCYILFSKKLDKFYIGSCTNFNDRIAEHNDAYYGKKKFTACTNDWEPFIVIECDSLDHARKMESKIKKMKSRVFINNLKQYPEMVKKLWLNSK